MCRGGTVDTLVGEMELPGRRRRGRPKRRFMDVVREEMQVVRIEDTENRVKWKTVIRCGNA